MVAFVISTNKKLPTTNLYFFPIFALLFINDYDY